MKTILQLVLERDIPEYKLKESDYNVKIDKMTGKDEIRLKREMAERKILSIIENLENDIGMKVVDIRKYESN